MVASDFAEPGRMKQIAFAIVAGIVAICTLVSSATANDLIDYGKHLSGECTACHRDGSTETIPPIVGWPTDAFITVMESYKKGERHNKVMVSVAESLDAEQIKALAAYFATVKSKDP